jgi:hypothetical protein
MLVLMLEHAGTCKLAAFCSNCVRLHDVGIHCRLLCVHLQMNGVTPLQSAVASGGEDCPCAVLLRQAGGALELASHRRPSNRDFFETPMRRVPCAMHDQARALGRSVPYYGQY